MYKEKMISSTFQIIFRNRDAGIIMLKGIKLAFSEQAICTIKYDVTPDYIP